MVHAQVTPSYTQSRRRGGRDVKERSSTGQWCRVRPGVLKYAQEQDYLSSLPRNRPITLFPYAHTFMLEL